MIVHQDGFFGAHFLSQLKRERATADRDHLRSRGRGQLRQERSEKSDSDKRHLVVGLYATALKDVHGAPERFSWKWFRIQGARQEHSRGGGSNIEPGVGVVRDQSHSIAGCEPDAVFADFFDSSPAFMTELARSEWI